MANRPFLAINTNIVDESVTTTTPGTIGSNSVLITQGQQRRVFDTVTTSVCGNPVPASQIGGNYMLPQQCYCPCADQSGGLRADAQYVPGGVVFTFRQPQWRSPVPINNPFMEHNFEQQDLGMLLLQEQFRKNPFMLQFHQNVKTSTSDLFNGPSMGQPDFNAASAFAANNLMKERSPINTNYSNARQLRLPENHSDKQPPPRFINVDEEKHTMANEGDGTQKNVTEMMTQTEQSPDAAKKDVCCSCSQTNQGKNKETENSETKDCNDEQKVREDHTDVSK